MKNNTLYLLLLLLGFTISVSAQKKTRREVLEARRVQLKKDQIYINALLSNTKRKERGLVTEVKDLEGKIVSRKNLINAIGKEAEELDRVIKKNKNKISANEKELNELKKDYAALIYKSYKSKSKQSRLIFLLSSENFYQIYKRFQYLKQYATFRKNQGLMIDSKTKKLKLLIDSLRVQIKHKNKLLGSKKSEQSSLKKEKNEQEGLLKSIKKKEKKYEKQIAQFQKEEQKVNAQIDRIIREAIKASNKDSGSSSKFKLTPEDRKLASKFTVNKGKLPWPLIKGYVSTRYGKQRHPVVSTIRIQSNGVRITTEEGSMARAVFEGTVLSIQIFPGNKKAVLIRHGNYISIYKNLQDVLVKKGDKVKTKQSLGKIFTDKITGKTILGFILSLNTETVNPATWIYNM